MIIYIFRKLREVHQTLFLLLNQKLYYEKSLVTHRLDMDTKERTIRWGRLSKKNQLRVREKHLPKSRVYDPLRVAERIRNLSLEKLQELESGVGCCIARAFRINQNNSRIKCIFLFFSVNVFFSQMIGNGVGKTSLKSNLEYLLVQIRPNYFNIRLFSFLLKKFIFYVSPNADMLPGGKWVGLEFAVYVSFVLHLILLQTFFFFQ